MKQTTHPLLLIAFAVSLFSCSKKDTPPPSTSLQITVADDITPAIGATVTLYASQKDLLSGSGALSSKRTDASGRATFSGLSELKYYFKAEAGCKNNLNGVVSSASPLGKGIVNTAVVKITPTGTLNLTNTSSHPYDVYATGIMGLDNMPGGTSQNLRSAPTGK